MNAWSAEVAVNDYITILGVSASSSLECAGTTLTTAYSCVKSRSCGPTGSGTITVEGPDGLSDNYKVTAVDGSGCITLCACP